MNIGCLLVRLAVESHRACSEREQTAISACIGRILVEGVVVLVVEGRAHSRPNRIEAGGIGVCFGLARNFCRHHQQQDKEGIGQSLHALLYYIMYIYCKDSLF